MERYDTRITLYDDGDMETTVPKALAWLQSLDAKIPPEFKDRSVFKVEYESDYYGGGSLDFKVYYDRPETDAEVAERLANQAASEAICRQQNEARERQIYEMLKQKFG